MHAIKNLNDRKWTHPSDYAGFSPEGDFVIVGQNRDSDALDRSNYERILEDLRKTAAGFAPPTDSDSPRNRWVYDWRAAHWAVGWVEYIMVRQDAPESILQAAGEIVGALADYPVYDEMHHSELEHDEALEYWEGLSLRERAEMCTRHGYSKFAARSNPCKLDYVYEELREA